MLYLLHFDKPLGFARHYLGCCAENRLQARLREHATGQGARLTARASAGGVTMYLARVFPEMSYEQEKRYKVASHFDKLCPLCCPMLARLAEPAYAINNPTTDNVPSRGIIDWRPLNYPPRPPAIEKGGR